MAFRPAVKLVDLPTTGLRWLQLSVFEFRVIWYILTRHTRFSLGSLSAGRVRVQKRGTREFFHRCQYSNKMKGYMSNKEEMGIGNR